MTDKQAVRLGVSCFFGVITAAAAVWLFYPLGVAKPGPSGRGQAPAVSSSEDSGSERPLPEIARAVRDGGKKVANSLRHALKGRENNFIGEVRDWARQDPEAALAWAQQQPNTDPARKEALIEVCFQIAQNDPKRAILLAEQYKLDRDMVLTSLARQWATKDLTTAYDWISKQTDDDQRNALGTGLALTWSKTDPAGAAQFVVQQMSPGSLQNDAVIMVLHQWAMVDRSGAAAWVQQFPEGPLRTTALSELSNLASQP